MFDKMLANKAECTPESGFNVVEFDDFEMPGEQLFVVSSHASKDEANAAVSKLKAKNADATYYVYGAES